MSADDFVISFGSAAGGDLIVSIASRSRRFSLDITRYPELTEFRMLTRDHRGPLDRRLLLDDRRAQAR